MGLGSVRPMGVGIQRRLCIAALAGGSVLMSCAPGSLSDAELVWCQGHLAAVASSGDSLGLPPPEGSDSWEDWAAVLVAGEQMLGGTQWDAMTVDRDRPNRDRACRAAYGSR
jgi:hypothetical protein